MDKQVSVKSTIFVGKSGSDTMCFVCLSQGGYAIQRNGEILSTCKDSELSALLSQFSAMIDHPHQPERPRSAA